MSERDLSTRFPSAAPGTVPLDEDAAPVHPLTLLQNWARVAVGDDLRSPIYVALATSSPDGVVSSRMVQLLDVEDDGLLMSTNFGSRKGMELTANPRAAISLFWESLGQSVNATGVIEIASDEENDERFAAEPRQVQVSRTVSFHGLPLDDEEAQLARFRALLESEDPLPRPDYWRWFRLRPDAVTFWEGHADALNRRLHYSLADGRWNARRIQA